MIWDNRGVLQALPYRADSARHMHRTTIKGDEPVALTPFWRGSSGLEPA